MGEPIVYEEDGTVHTVLGRKTEPFDHASCKDEDTHLTCALWKNSKIVDELEAEQIEVRGEGISSVDTSYYQHNIVLDVGLDKPTEGIVNQKEDKLRIET